MKEDFTETRIPPLSMVAIQIMQYDPDSMDASSYSMEQIVSPDKGGQRGNPAHLKFRVLRTFGQNQNAARRDYSAGAQNR